MKYKVKFRIIGDKPPFTVTLHENSVNEPPVIEKTVTTSNIIDYLEDTQTYTISPIKEYCIKAVDDISNNVHVCEIPYPDIPPIAKNVTLGGFTVVGSQLTGSYLYYDDNGDPESGSLFKWYRSDDNKGTNKIQISGVFTQQYTLTNDDIGKYIQFSVTPKNLNATGDEFFSNYSGLIKSKAKPIITGYLASDDMLTWVMNDNSDASSGSWMVEYCLDGKETCKNNTGSGSPRMGVLRNKTYEEVVYFRVKGVTGGGTEWSDVYTYRVPEVLDYSQDKTSTVNLSDDSDEMPFNISFCTVQAQYVASNIYLKNKYTTIGYGTQLYFKANDGKIRKATKDNLKNNPSHGATGRIETGIKHIRFNTFVDTYQVWDVDPDAGYLTLPNETLCG